MTRLGVCTRHPDAPAAVACRQCGDALCRRCLAPGEADLCVLCADFRRGEVARAERIEAGLPVEPAWPLRRHATRAIIGGLVVLDVLALLVWLVPTRTGLGSPVDQMRGAMSTVQEAVEGARDPAGRVPERLDALLPSLPPDVADMAKSGAIVYAPSADRRQFEILVALRVSVGTQPAGARP